MKKNILFAVFMGLALILSITSCEKDDDNGTPASVVAKFSFTSDNDFMEPSTITFKNESVIPDGVGTATYAWDFGDGGTATDKDPVYKYEAAGTYTVKLTVKTDVDPVEYTQDITIQKGELFFEDFESIDDGGDLPDTWVVVDVDGGTPSDDMYDKAWKVVESSQMGSKIAVSTSYYTDADYPDADDWMITPAIEIVDGAYLSFDAKSLTSSGNYPDSYEVWVSTTDQDVAGCKAGDMIHSVDEEEHETAQSYDIDLSSYAGKTVYIGFRLMTPAPGGSELGVDNVKVYVK